MLSPSCLLSSTRSCTITVSSRSTARNAVSQEPRYDSNNKVTGLRPQEIKFGDEVHPMYGTKTEKIDNNLWMTMGAELVFVRLKECAMEGDFGTVSPCFLFFLTSNLLTSSLPLPLPLSLSLSPFSPHRCFRPSSTRYVVFIARGTIFCVRIHSLPCARFLCGTISIHLQPTPHCFPRERSHTHVG